MISDILDYSMKSWKRWILRVFLTGILYLGTKKREVFFMELCFPIFSCITDRVDFSWFQVTFNWRYGTTRIHGDVPPTPTPTAPRPPVQIPAKLPTPHAGAPWPWGDGVLPSCVWPVSSRQTPTRVLRTEPWDASGYVAASFLWNSSVPVSRIQATKVGI